MIEKAFVSVVKTPRSGYFLLASKIDQTWNIQGFKSLEEGIAYYENGYKEFHNRSYESSMSASINWMQYQPSILEATLEDLHKVVKEKTIVRLWCVAGGFYGVPLIEEEAEKMWEAGKKPELINDKMFGGKS